MKARHNWILKATKRKPNPDLTWDRERLNEILGRLAGKRILVVGDVGLDRYTIGSVERISPEAPVPIVLVEEERLKLGLAANVADNIKALGGVPLLVGITGEDRSGEDFGKLLKTSGIQSTHLVVDASRRTVLKERVVSERQQLVRIDYESSHPVDHKVEARVLAKIKQLLGSVDAVILEDYAKGMMTPNLAHAALALVRSAGKIAAVDPNSKTPIETYRGAYVLTPNTKEAESLSGFKIRDEESLKKAGQTILKLTQAKHVVITRGKEGMAIFSAGTPSVRKIPTFAQEVYDVSGAGDTVISVLTLALASGSTIEEASILGNLAAGVEVGKRGTATVAPSEIRAALEYFEI